ncbi:MAG: aminopeptidase, partial [Chloroflexota bacterium]|nr:aminopeptidase [Chloroflexota bacterium]
MLAAIGQAPRDVVVGWRGFSLPLRPVRPYLGRSCDERSAPCEAGPSSRQPLAGAQDRGQGCDLDAGGRGTAGSRGLLEALRAGAHPVARISLNPSLAIGSFDGLTEITLREGSEEQIRFSEFDLQEIERYDALLVIWADENTKGMRGISPERMALAQQASGPVMGRMMERAMAGELRWCITLFPTVAHAQEAGMALSEYEEFVLDAGLLDRDDPAAAWREAQAEMQRVAS